MMGSGRWRESLLFYFLSEAQVISLGSTVVEMKILDIWHEREDNDMGNRDGGRS